MPAKEVEYVIVGGGVAGLAGAYTLARQGKTVRVLEAQSLGSGAFLASAGMLAPTYEIDFQETELLDAFRESQVLYQQWRKELPDFGYQETGTLEVPLTREDLPYVQRQYEFRKNLGLPIEWLEGEALRKIVPRLSPKITAGSFCSQDHQVDPILLKDALTQAGKEYGVIYHEKTPVVAYGQENSHVWAQSEAGEKFYASKLLISVGVPKAGIDLPFKVYAVRGQMVSVSLPSPSWLLHPVRYFNRIYGYGYCVPKRDRMIIGSTAEEKGPYAHLTVGGVLDILRRAHLAFPDIEELPIQGIWAGLRPATLARHPVFYQNGHIYYVNGLYRNGVLLAPLVGQAIAKWLVEGQLPHVFRSFLHGT